MERQWNFSRSSSDDKACDWESSSQEGFEHLTAIIEKGPTKIFRWQVPMFLNLKGIDPHGSFTCFGTYSRVSLIHGLKSGKIFSFS